MTVPRNFSNPRFRPPIPRTAVENLIAHHAMDGTMDHEGQMNAAMLTGFRDELTREAGVVTPGVDETPYIQYAIEQLTRDRDTGYYGNDSLDSDETAPVTRVVDGEGLGYYQPTAVPRPMSGPQHGLQTPSSTSRRLGSQLPETPPPTHLHYERDHNEPGHFTLARFNTTRPLTPVTPVPLDERLSFSERIQTPPKGQDVSWKVGPIPTKEIEQRPGLATVPMGTNRTGPTRMKTAGGTPALQYRPRMLWPTSFIILILLCLLMLAALIFCAIDSQNNNGFVAYSGSIYSGQYFTFRILPQLLAACILIYAQAIITTMVRILPFIRLASMDRAEREKAIYLDLYPRYIIWPQLVDRWQIWLPMLVTWVMYLTLPLQSSLFTVILVDGTWRWATVQGVAWTLVAMYLALVIAMGEAGIYWWTRIHHTGLRWDPRSLAAIIAMVSDTNVAGQYRGTEIAARRSTISFALKHRRVEKLGYWPGKDGFVYALKSMETPTARGFGDVHEKTTGPNGEMVYITPRDLEASAHTAGVRYRYLPVCLRDGTIIFSVVAATVLLVALFVVSFIPSTRITTAGFIPSLPAAPTPTGFSPANFLYSFIPSLIGLLLYLAFESLDLHLRILQPWAAMSSPQGATAQQSILADYAACLPLQTVYRAVRNGHYRLAVVSGLSTLFILLPILGGGIFMALTDAVSLEVKMYPNIPVFGIVLALLVLYLGGLVALVPYRHGMRLPHGVTCLAEVIGFLVNEEMLAERRFKQVATRGELVGRLVAGGERWGFGVGEGREEVLGVRRVRRFTEKRGVRKSQIRRGGETGRGGG